MRETDHQTSSHPARGLALGDRQILSIRGQNSLDFLEAVFACYARRQLLAISRPDTGFGALAGQVSEHPLPGEGGRTGWGRLTHVPDHGDEPAQIVFTSGTEGPPKRIVLSHRNLSDVVERLNAVMGLTPDVREYVGVPVHYSFGLGRVRAVSAAGGAFFLPRAFDPLEIRRMLEEDAINAISAVPSLWRIVLGAPDILRPLGHKLRWIEIGSQYMSGEEKAALKRLFPRARIVQHYGMTEASRTTFLVVSDHDGAVLESVGQATGSARTRILPDGRIAIRGAHVALGRLMDDGEIRPLVDREGWLHSNDLGTLRDGFLYYRGRADDQINMSGIKLGAESLEARIAELVPAATGHFAVAPVADALRGEAIRIAAEPPAGALLPLLRVAAVMALEDRGISAAGAVHTLALDRLPRTETNKIRRAALREAAAEPVAGPGPDPAAPLPPDQARVADTWRKVVGPLRIGPEHSFYDLGGDSLSGMQVGLIMEAAGFDRAAVRATFEGRSLAEVAALAAGGASGGQADAGTDRAPLPDHTQRNWALSVTRAVAVLAVLLSHWGTGFFNRLGGLGEVLENFLGPVYAMGTESFAVVFGLGVGMTMLPGHDARAESVRFRVRRAFLLVAAGLALIVVTRLILYAMQGREIGGLALSHAAYNVLVFYLVMLGTAPWWLRRAAAWRNTIPNLLAASAGLLALLLLARGLVTTEQQNSLLELPRLMAVAGYSVFYMGAIAAFGMAAGYWVSQVADTRRVAGTLTATGLIGAGLCALVLVQANGLAALGNRESAALTSIPALFFYGFLMLLVFGTALRLMGGWPTLPALPRLVLKMAIVIGALALPVYVLHGLVIPVKDVLELAGLRSAIALILPMAAFLLITGLGGWHVYRSYFR